MDGICFLYYTCFVHVQYKIKLGFGIVLLPIDLLIYDNAVFFLVLYLYVRKLMLVYNNIAR